MSNVLAWVRKSKGSDDDIGLEEQREKVFELAAEYDPDYEDLDLGVQTGFSTMSRDPDAPTTWLDQNPRVQGTIEDLEAGEYDHLVAFDDDRVCRDGYMNVIEYNAKMGDCEIVFHSDVPEDDLTYDLERRIERHTKEEEIEKSRRAIERRKEQGYDHGRPKFGMQYDAQGKYQVPGEEFDTVMEILRMRSDGATYAEISDETDVPKATVCRVVDRREWYIEREKLSERQPTQ